MGTYRDRPVPKDAKTFYGITDKEPGLERVSQSEDASKVLRDLIKDKYGFEPVTIPQLSRELLGKRPYQLSYYEVAEMVKKAKDLGYLEAARL